MMIFLGDDYPFFFFFFLFSLFMPFLYYITFLVWFKSISARRLFSFRFAVDSSEARRADKCACEIYCIVHHDFSKRFV